MDVHPLNTFIASMLAQFCITSLTRFSDSRHGITLPFTDPVFPTIPVFPKIPVAESNGCYVFATYGLCVCGGNPCSEGLSSHVHF